MLEFERSMVRVTPRRASARAERECRGAWRRAVWWGAAAAFAGTVAIAQGVRADVPEAGGVPDAGLSVPSLSGPSLSVQGPLPAGTPIVVRFTGLSTDGHEWIAVAPTDYGDAAYDEWITTGGHRDGTVAFRGQAPGTYAIRAFSETPERHVIAEITVTVPRRHGPAAPAMAFTE